MRPDNGHAICGAKTRSGEPCRAYPMPNGRCRMHAGNAAKGRALPQFKHGRFSKYLPARLQEHALAAMTDPELLSQREAIAVLDARLTELIQTIGTGFDWAAAHAAVDQIMAAPDVDAMRDAVVTLRRVIVGGRAADLAWREIRETFDDRRKLIESERKRLIEMEQMVSMEQVYGMLGALMDSFSRHTSDRAVLAHVIDDYTALVSRTQ